MGLKGEGGPEEGDKLFSPTVLAIFVQEAPAVEGCTNSMEVIAI